MEESFLQIIRPVIFVGLLVGFALIEFLLPRRELKPIKTRRWITNLLIIFIDSAVVKLMLNQRQLASHFGLLVMAMACSMW